MILTLNLRPDVTVLAVPVPDDAWDITLLPLSNSVMWWHKGFESDGVRFEPGSYELIGLLREVTEDVAKNLVGMPITGSVYNFTLTPHLNLLKDKIEWAGGDPKQNWLIIKKIA